MMLVDFQYKFKNIKYNFNNCFRYNTKVRNLLMCNNVMS